MGGMGGMPGMGGGPGGAGGMDMAAMQQMMAQMGGGAGGAGGAELSTTAGLTLLQFAIACSVEADNEPALSAAAAPSSSTVALADAMCMTLRRMMAMGGASQTSDSAGDVDARNGHTNGYTNGYAMYAPSLDVVLDCLVGLHSKVSADGKSESGARSACVESLELLRNSEP
mmetsp:Transcript_57704/g.159046  ORF Transcript_57704/g.159046 Transcript_57704/m.159046 type:complete len:171 (-) Transcript_57704:605-1117(-)